MDLTVLGMESGNSLWISKLKHRLGWGAAVLAGSHSPTLHTTSTVASVDVVWGGGKGIVANWGGPSRHQEWVSG